MTFGFQEFFPALDQRGSHPLVGHQMQMINLLLIHNFAIYKFFVNSNSGRDKLIMYFITEDLPVDSSEVATALRIKQVRHLS